MYLIAITSFVSRSVVNYLWSSIWAIFDKLPTWQEWTSLSVNISKSLLSRIPYPVLQRILQIRGKIEIELRARQSHLNQWWLDWTAFPKFNLDRKISLQAFVFIQLWLSADDYWSQNILYSLFRDVRLKITWINNISICRTGSGRAFSQHARFVPNTFLLKWAILVLTRRNVTQASGDSSAVQNVKIYSRRISKGWA